MNQLSEIISKQNFRHVHQVGQWKIMRAKAGCEQKKSPKIKISAKG